MEEAERLELQAAGIQGKTSARGGMDLNSVKLSVKLKDALLSELPYFAKHLVLMQENLSKEAEKGGQGTKKGSSHKDGSSIMKKVPYYLANSEKMRDIYLSPLGEKVKDIQKELVEHAGKLYTEMRQILDVVESLSEENSKGVKETKAVKDTQFLGAKCTVALAGVRLLYFYSLTDLGSALRNLLTELYPVPAGELASTEQAREWSKLIYSLAQNEDINLSLFALEKLKTLPPFPMVLREISRSTIE
ncbi:MAG: hypothetical protein LBF22_08845, partial [Deltaproteobacteria bacterium]|nr:hypothetical protein [Deltaproteobacteria bacterium]